MVQQKKKKVEQSNSGEGGGWCCSALLTSLTAVLCFWMADVLRESACVREFVQAGRVCSWVQFMKGVWARVTSQGQPGSQALHLAVCQETLWS